MPVTVTDGYSASLIIDDAGKVAGFLNHDAVFYSSADRGEVTLDFDGSYDSGAVTNDPAHTPAGFLVELTRPTVPPPGPYTVTATWKVWNNAVGIGTLLVNLTATLVVHVSPPFTNASMGHFAIYNRVLDADAIARHYEAGHTAFSGDHEGVRLNRILDYADWPADWRDIDTGAASLTGENWDDGSATLDELHDAEANGGGVLFMSKDGKVTYRGRLSRVGVEPATTFAVDGPTAPEAPLAWSVDDTHVVNIITATRDAPGGISTTVIDQPSVDDLGEFRDDSFSLKVTTDKELIDRARDKLQRYKEPDVRVSQLVLNCSAGQSAEFWADVLGLEIGSCILLDNLPDYAPGDSLAYFIESVNDAVVIDGTVPIITFTYDLSPAAIWADWSDPTDHSSDPATDDTLTPDPVVSGDIGYTSDDDSVTMTWEATGTLPFADHYIVWLYADDGVTLVAGPFSVDAAGDLSYTFTGLDALTHYRFHIVAQTGDVNSSTVSVRVETAATPGSLAGTITGTTDVEGTLSIARAPEDFHIIGYVGFSKSEVSGTMTGGTSATVLEGTVEGTTDVEGALTYTPAETGGESLGGSDQTSANAISSDDFIWGTPFTLNDPITLTGIGFVADNTSNPSITKVAAGTTLEIRTSYTGSAIATGTVASDVLVGSTGEAPLASSVDLDAGTTYWLIAPGGTSAGIGMTLTMTPTGVVATIGPNSTTHFFTSVGLAIIFQLYGSD